MAISSVICLYAAFLCDILLIVTFIMNTTGIPPSEANPIGRTFPPLFTLNLPKDDQIIKDLEDIAGMQTTIQVISFIFCAIVPIILLYHIFK